MTPEGNQLTLAYRCNGQSEPLATLDRNEAGTAQFKILREKDERLTKAQVILRLTSHYAIQKELSLPIAAKESLYQVVGYELDRYTPFKPEQVYFAVKRLDGANEPGHIRVMLILTPRDILDGFFEDIKAMGLSPQLADYDGSAIDLDQFDDSYNLLPDRLRQKTEKLPRIIYSALVTLTCLLLVAVKALQKDIDAVIDETRQFLAEKIAVPEVLLMLNTLSSLIKDDTWLSYAQYSDGHLQIQGESPTASTLIAVLEASELFDHAQFASPVTQDTVSKLERFQITVDVTPAGRR